jgi:hypothetical protein
MTFRNLHAGDRAGESTVTINRPVTMKVEREDSSPSIRSGLSAEEVANAVRNLGMEDATVTIFREGTDENLMVAVSGQSAFLGLERLDGLFQHVSYGNYGRERRRLKIGNQETDIESRYVLDLATAAKVIREWLDKGEKSSFGFWERQ